MRRIIEKLNNRKRGSVLVLSMLFLMIFATLAVGLASMSSTSLKLADNQRSANGALSAAYSGIECSKNLARTYVPAYRTGEAITSQQADAAWSTFVAHVRTSNLGGVTVATPIRESDDDGWYDLLTIPAINFEGTSSFELQFKRYDSEPHKIILTSVGKDKDAVRKVQIEMNISRDSRVLEYAIASRGRMIITGDTTINGDICSTWYKANWHPPFEVTSDVVINGTLNTNLTAQELAANDNQMETLDSNWLAVYDEFGNRVINVDDAVQGEIEGVNYGVDVTNIPGLDEDDYDTSSYIDGCTAIPYSSSVVVEYFPHANESYSERKQSWNTKFYRSVYTSQTFTNAILPKGRNALFQDCTFEGVLYIESDDNASSTSKCNNVRFDNCTFNGTIVTTVPKNNFIQWRHNVLYFTGGASFNNNYMEEVTILAPNFNVNLGNTRTFDDSSNTIEGAIVGGIVDIRGNAYIEGTVISMYDTFAHSDGYVSNVGYALDGGDEGGNPIDAGTIVITPPESKMLPGGIISDIVVVPDQSSCAEVY